jgi:hypothetical protein
LVERLLLDIKEAGVNWETHRGVARSVPCSGGREREEATKERVKRRSNDNSDARERLKKAMKTKKDYKTYIVKIHKYDTGTPEEFLKWQMTLM